MVEIARNYKYQEIANERSEEAFERLVRNYETYGASVPHIITGPMKAGKTNIGLQMAYYLESEGGMKVTCFQPSTNVRESRIESRTGDSSSAIIIDSSEEILDIIMASRSRSGKLEEHLSNQAIFVDEVHFLDAGIVEVVRDLRALNVAVFLSFLNQDFRGEPFEFRTSKAFELFKTVVSKIGFGEYVHTPNVGDLLALGPSVIYIDAVCDKGGHATMTERVGVESDKLVIVGDGSYQPVPSGNHPYVEARRKELLG